MFLCSSFSYYYEASERLVNGLRIRQPFTWPGPLGYFEGLDSSHYKQIMDAIEHRWEKCIELKGDYVEK